MIRPELTHGQGLPKTANSRVWPTCLSKIICGQPLSRLAFFHLTRTITADSLMTTRDDSVFIICATAWRHFSSESEPIQRSNEHMGSDYIERRFHVADD